MVLNELSYKIRDATFSVYNELGPRLLENVYKAAFVYELLKIGLKVQNQVALPVFYKDVKLELDYRLDILVEIKLLSK